MVEIVFSEQIKSESTPLWSQSQSKISNVEPFLKFSVPTQNPSFKLNVAELIVTVPPKSTVTVPVVAKISTDGSVITILPPFSIFKLWNVQLCPALNVPPFSIFILVPTPPDAAKAPLVVIVCLTINKSVVLAAGVATVHVPEINRSQVAVPEVGQVPFVNVLYVPFATSVTSKEVDKALLNNKPDDITVNCLPVWAKVCTNPLKVINPEDTLPLTGEPVNVPDEVIVVAVVKSKSLLPFTSFAETVGDGVITPLTTTFVGACTNANLSAITSILFLSVVVLEVAPPAFAAANNELPAAAVTEAIVNCNCWLSVTTVLKVILNVKFSWVPSSAVTFAPLNPENEIVPAPIVGELLTNVFALKSAAVLILAILVTLNVIADNSVPKASASVKVAPPSRSVNWKTPILFAVFVIEAAW